MSSDEASSSQDIEAETYTIVRMSERAAPSLRSDVVVTGRESSKVAKKWKKASSSLRSSICYMLVCSLTPVHLLSQPVPGDVIPDIVSACHVGSPTLD